MSSALDTLKSDLNNLKSVIKSPRLYLSDYFTELRNKIDIQCETTIRKAVEKTREQLEHQSLLIEEVNSFEKECFLRLDKNGLLSNAILKQVKTLMTTIESNYKSGALDTGPKLNEIKSLLDEIISDMHKTLFIARGIVFLANEFLATFIPGIENQLETFGLLVIVEDEFISSRLFQNR